MSNITRTHSTARMSKIVRHGDLVYLCGQTSSGSVATDMAGQTGEVLSRIDALLKDAGTDKSKLLTALIHVRSMDDFAAMNAVCARRADRVPHSGRLHGRRQVHQDGCDCGAAARQSP